MSSLNTSTNGPSITASYQKIVNSAPPSGGAAASSTYGQWAVFVVQAPLVSAFQGGAGKESVLKVQSTGEGELADLIEEFSDGRIQFAYVKVKDSNTALPKNVLIAWCGEGVPERTKGYFGSHLEAVSKLLHGYHVQVTARSDRDLTPESIVQKVADASGAKYGGGPSAPTQSRGPPPVASKPVFQPTKVGGGSLNFSPSGGRSRDAPAPSSNTDADGWGEDAPELTRTQLEKVGTAYKPTKVNIAEIQRNHQASSYVPESRASETPSDVVRGGYQPIGKVDIGAIRRQAQESGQMRDERPTTVKGAYEPVGKVDIGAIRSRAQGNPPPTAAPVQNVEPDAAPKSLSERSAAFQSSERMTSLPKPKVANKFGGNSFTGTKAPTVGGFGGMSVPTTAPVGTASKTFADEGGKTPAQIWAEKKARERGSSITSGSGNAAPITSQPSGNTGFESSYEGKKWATVSINKTGRSDLSAQRTGDRDEQDEDNTSASGGVGSIRERFSAAPEAPRMDMSSKPNSSARGVPMPGLPIRSAAQDEDRRDEHVSVPPPPAVPRMDTPEPEEDEEDYRDSSPVRIAMPVSRSQETELEPAEELHPPPALPVASIAKAARSMPPPPQEEEEEEEEDDARGASQAMAQSNFGASAVAAVNTANQGGKRAIVQYDYEKAEDNEIELREGAYVTNIDMVDDDWWMGTNDQGEVGLFPSNYVEIVEDEAGESIRASAPASHAGPAPTQPQAPVAPGAGPAGGGLKKLPTATAQYEYEAGEDNELSFPEGATVTNVEFPDEDWWLGEYDGKQGLFPANYVQLDE